MARERTRSNHGDDDDDGGYLDLNGLARYSGLSVSTIRRRQRDPEHPLPGHRVHGRWLFSRREFDQWLRTQPTGDAPNGPADTGWIRRAFNK